MSTEEHRDRRPEEATDPALPRVEDAGDESVVVYDDEQALVDGVPFTGVIISWHSNGSLASELTYRDGLPDGLCRVWYPNGQIKSKRHARWNDGVYEARSWYPDGSLRHHTLSETDEHPEERWDWYPNGQLESYMRRRIGQWQDYSEWDEAGTLIEGSGGEGPIPS